MTENMFWQIIEDAWQKSPSSFSKRVIALKTNDENLLFELSEYLSTAFLTHYRAALLILDKATLTQFIHILEEKLFQIDRQEIHEFTDGGDDGFLYCRCFIVGMGNDYFSMVDKQPAKATMDLESEIFGFEAYSIYEEKFGEEFERNSVYCIESCSNEKHWDLMP